MTHSQENADEIWASCLKHLEANEPLSSADLDTYLRPVQAALDGSELVLYAPNQFARDALQSTFMRGIKAGLPAGTAIRLVIGNRPKHSARHVKEQRPVSPPSPTPSASGMTAAGAKPLTAPKAERRPQRGVIERDPDYIPAIWGDSFRAIPNDFVRAALFTVNRYGENTERPRRERQLMHAQSGIRMYVTGEETNQDDLDVLMQLMHFQRDVRVGHYMSFSSRQVMECLGRAINGRNHAALIASMRRLRQTTVEFVDENGVKASDFQLISEFHRDDSDPSNPQGWSVMLPQIVRELFSNNSYTRIHWEQSQKLSSLAKALHRYWSSHQHPYPLSTEFLHKLSGTNVSELRKFRARLKEALDELVEVGFLHSWSYDQERDIFAVKRNHQPLEHQKANNP